MSFKSIALYNLCCLTVTVGLSLFLALFLSMPSPLSLSSPASCSYEEQHATTPVLLVDLFIETNIIND